MLYSFPGGALHQDAKSPFWMAQWALSNGSRMKRSTKVPVEGGVFQGVRLSKPQAKRPALLVAQELAAAAQVEAQRQDNLSVRELLDTVLKGKLGRLSVSTYDNARTTYARSTAWLGERRAAQPLRLVTRAALAAAYAGGGYLWARERYPWDQAQGGDAATWVLPRLRVHSNPSPEFTQLVRLHGIGLRGEKGAGNRRVWHSKTFHSLRATVVRCCMLTVFPRVWRWSLWGMIPVRCMRCICCLRRSSCVRRLEDCSFRRRLAQESPASAGLVLVP